MVNKEKEKVAKRNYRLEDEMREHKKDVTWAEEVEQARKQWL